MALSVAVSVGAWRRLETNQGIAALLNVELILVTVIWLIFGLCIFGKRFYRLGGKRLAYSTVMAFALVICVLLGGHFGRGAYD